MDDLQSASSKVQEASMPRNGFAKAGLIVGILSIFLFELGIIPLSAIVLSGLGLAKARQRGGKGRVQAWVGLVLGILYLVVNAYRNGHLG